jgi:hypothetical protein
MVGDSGLLRRLREPWPPPGSTEFWELVRAGIAYYRRLRAARSRTLAEEIPDLLWRKLQSYVRRICQRTFPGDYAGRFSFRGERWRC